MAKTDLTKILTDDEVSAAADAMRETFGTLAATVDLEQTVRFLSLSKACQGAREQRGLSIKDAAALLKVPQYRLKAIEQGSLKLIEPGTLHAYVGLLELGAYFEEWAAANPALRQSFLPG